MERRRIDEYEPGTVPSLRPLDKFGFVKQERSSASPERVTKSRSFIEFERYALDFVFPVKYYKRAVFDYLL